RAGGEDARGDVVGKLGEVGVDDGQLHLGEGRARVVLRTRLGAWEHEPVPGGAGGSGPAGGERRLPQAAVEARAVGVRRPGLGVEQMVGGKRTARDQGRSEEHTSELQSRFDLVCRLLLEKKKKRRT